MSGLRARREPGGTATPPHRKVAALGLVLLMLMTAVSVVSTVGIVDTERDVDHLAVDGRAYLDVQSLTQSVAGIQIALEQAYSSTGTERETHLSEWDDRTTALIEQRSVLAASDDTQAVIEQIDATLQPWLRAVYTARTAIGERSPGADAQVDMGSSREAYAAWRSQILELMDGWGDDLLDEAQGTQHGTSRWVAVVIAVGAVGLLIGLVAVRSAYRTAAAQDHEIMRRDEARAIELWRGEAESRINRALEYSRTERDAARVVEQSIEQLLPDRPTELLVADSSRAHFSCEARTHRDRSWSGCGVPTPVDCPALNSGQSLVFDSSEKFDACPFLKDRANGPLSATCVPVSINGAAQAVLHSTGPDGVRPDPEVRAVLELVGSRAGDRIGVLRAFHRSESQAATDPLTGLDNRRSFENKVAELLRQGHRLVVGFGDLDHFKRLNDAHGHDTGDRALRAFARTIRQAVRPDDVVARWGGEEFVVALPDTSDEVAVTILERVRGELARVVAAGSVPPFTVSFGVSEGTEADLAAQIAAADRALLAAKRAGRDRVVRAAQLQSGTSRNGRDGHEGLVAVDDAGDDRGAGPEETFGEGVATEGAPGHG